MKNMIQSVKGTREFYPPQMEFRRWLYSKIEEVSTLFGYQEFDGPFLEKIELYAAKSGEELVKEQAFVFPDRGGDLITLRPELTPSLARMIAKNQNELAFPLRWWSFGPFWRYERPQKGRSREFFQWNIDLIGVDSPEADAELLAICATFFQNVGLTPKEVKISINNRILIDQEIRELGIDFEMKKEVFHLIDRREKMKPEEWNSSGLASGLSQPQLDGILKLLSNFELWKKSPELNKIFNILEKYGVSEYISYDPRIVRGLDYYTGVVFEAWDACGDGRAILGGGHYDNLVGDVGGDPLPGVGFAMGDVMISVLLEKYRKLSISKQFRDIVLVTVFGEELNSVSTEFAVELRKSGTKAILYPEVVKLTKQLKFANRIGITIAIVIGPDEKANGNITIKDLRDGTQQIVSRTDGITVINRLLASATLV